MAQIKVVWGGAVVVTMILGLASPARAQQAAAESRNPFEHVRLDGAAARQHSVTFNPPARPLTEWMADRPERRPAVLPALYATFGALQVFDAYSTRQAIGAGAHEANPIMVGPASHAGAMLAVKALSAVGSIFVTERAWKKNRKAAVVLMAALNAASTAVVLHNTRNARTAR